MDNRSGYVLTKKQHKIAGKYVQTDNREKEILGILFQKKRKFCLHVQE